MFSTSLKLREVSDLPKPEQKRRAGQPVGLDPDAPHISGLPSAEEGRNGRTLALSALCVRIQT